MFIVQLGTHSEDFIQKFCTFVYKFLDVTVDLNATQKNFVRELCTWGGVFLIQRCMSVMR